MLPLWYQMRFLHCAASHVNEALQQRPGHVASKQIEINAARPLTGSGGQ